MLLALAACQPLETHGLPIDGAIAGILWLDEPDEGEPRLEAVDRMRFGEYERLVGAKDRVTVLAYAHDLAEDLIDIGPVAWITEGRDLPAPDRIFTFDPAPAEWRALDAIPDPFTRAKLPPFDHARCADAGGCLTGKPSTCTLPCPTPMAPMPPDPPLPPEAPRGVPPELPPRVPCGPDLVQWRGAADCAPIDACPASAPPGSIFVRAGERIGDALLGATAGTSVVVDAGTFTERISVPPGVRLIGTCVRDTKLGPVFLNSDSSIEHAEVESIGIPPSAERAAVRFVAVASSTINPVLNLGSATTMENLVVRAPVAVVALQDAGSSSITGAVIEGGWTGLSLLGETTLANVVVRDTSTVAISVYGGRASADGLSIVSDRGIAIGVAAGSAVHVSSVVVVGTKPPVATTDSTFVADRVRVASTTGLELSRSRVELTDLILDHSGEGPSIAILASTATLARSVVRSERGGPIVLGDAEVVLLDIDLAGSGVLAMGTQTDIARLRIEDAPTCLSSVEGSVLAATDVTILASKCEGIASEGEIRVERALIDLEDGYALALESFTDEPILEDAVLRSIDIVRADVGFAIQEWARPIQVERARISASQYAVSAEQGSAVEIRDVRIDGAGIGLEIDSTTFVTVERFDFAGSGRSGAQVIGNFAPNVEGAPTGLHLIEGRIGPAYSVGVSIQASGYDLANILDRVVILARPSILVSTP